jgi:hypothetical protein
MPTRVLQQIGYQLALVLWCTFLLPNSLAAQDFNEVIKAVASDRARDDRFGFSASISGDYFGRRRRHRDEYGS